MNHAKLARDYLAIEARVSPLPDADLSALDRQFITRMCERVRSLGPAATVRGKNAEGRDLFSQAEVTQIQVYLFRLKTILKAA